MKILLTAVNAKYIHTCPAVYSLKAYAESRNEVLPEIRIAEYTINDRFRDVLSGIMEEKADVIAFSTYIWNIDYICRLIRDIRRVREHTVQIWAGGPEASYAPEDFLHRTDADLVMVGEGEETFSILAALVMKPGFLADPGGGLQGIRGIAYLKHDRMVHGGMAEPVELARIPFLYQDLSGFSNRILYYESSRGCPFSCAYCLSGKEHGVRYRPMDLVLKELRFFLDHHVKQVKFTDRTFNASEERALVIWRYLEDHDNGVTNFHFEIEADRMTEEELKLLAGFRPGLVQLEIGVQSANPQTLKSVHRNTSLAAVQGLMEALTPAQNINLHLDLIAGLPFEDMESFRHSFQKVYDMCPHQLQLGFLKLLPGTELYERRDEYGLICSETAPYEILRTKWISYEELALLHRISDRVEEFVNSQGFRRCLPLIGALFPDAFSLFAALAEYYRANGYEIHRPSVQQRYTIFKEFVQQELEHHPEVSAEERSRILETLKLDQALHVHASRRMQNELELLVDGMVRKYHIDYLHCSPVNGEAAYKEIGQELSLPYYDCIDKSL